MLQKGDKKTMNAWAFYDWANSVYPLVISTAIFPIFFESVTSTKDVEGNVISDLVNFWGIEIKNTVLYSYVVAASFLMVSMLVPSGFGGVATRPVAPPRTAAQARHGLVVLFAGRGRPQRPQHRQQ